ncbi:MAG: DUF1905 domain-containing protein [Flavobacteriaceae bacterium]|nr:DUF1905 domain-containing protein [Flavobacteriaceae bacterium]
MTLAKTKYQFIAKLWKTNGPGAWYFISLPQDISTEIRNLVGWQEKGWGRLKAVAQIKSSPWDTAIWFDTKKKGYLLPIKAEIRKKEKLQLDMEVSVELWI